jgi:hypothetical protein
MLKNILRLICFGLLLFPSHLCAQQLSGGGTLTEPVGARPSGMGEMFSALSGDVYALHYNVAGISDLAAATISTMYMANMFENKTAQLIFGLPISAFGPGTLAVSMMNFMGAPMEVNHLDGSSETLISQNDFLGILGYGQQLSAHAFVGIGLKYYSSTLVEEYHAQALGLDLGFQYALEDLPGLRLGATVQNLGGNITYIEHGDSMPTTFRMGLAYSFALKSLHDLQVGTDLLFPNDNNPQQNIGIEYSWQNMLFARAGYKIGYDLGFFTAGAGVHLLGFQMDYAFSGREIGGNVHRFSLGYVFSEDTE